MKKFRFIIGSNMLEIEDLGNQAINDAFEAFYNDYFVNHQLNWPNLWALKDSFFDEVEAKQIPFTNPEYLDCKARYHDGFFNNFTIAWQNELGKGNYRNAILIWEKAISLAKDWEAKKRLHIHKGTPLYFQAVTCLENDEVEIGFALMHEAYLEDYFKNGNNDNFTSPGKSFVEFKVDDNTAFYRVKLEEIKQFFENEFLSNTGLSFEDFRTRFSENGNIEILIKYQFLLNVFRIWKAYKHFGGFNITNPMVGLLYMEAIFSLCRLIEPIYKAVKDPNPSFNKDVYAKLCGTTPNIFDHINMRNFGNEGFIREMSNIYTNKTVRIGANSYTLSDKEKDTLLAYGFRNLSAHDLYQNDFINQNIKGILQSIFRTLFETFR